MSSSDEEFREWCRESNRRLESSNRASQISKQVLSEYHIESEEPEDRQLLAKYQIRSEEELEECHNFWLWQRDLWREDPDIYDAATYNKICDQCVQWEQKLRRLQQRKKQRRADRPTVEELEEWERLAHSWRETDEADGSPGENEGGKSTRNRRTD
mmetsp:Transcript_5537/g.11127  ORF Transcript_5537/g.11127 Transcript_5537/m.11127 type:complete len:156 (+) Transcript_5537:199-666(+)